MGNNENKRKRAKPQKQKNESEQNCYNCEHCVYVGEGGYICAQNNSIVIDEWMPTYGFNSCRGKGFVKI